MSNSIWKTPDEYNYGEDYEVKDEAIVVDTGNKHYRAYRDFYDMPHHCDDPDCCFADIECWKRWAKVTDLIAQADKAERLLKAVDLAQEHLLSISDGYDIMKADSETIKRLFYAIQDEASETHKEIKQLIKEN